MQVSTRFQCDRLVRWSFVLASVVALSLVAACGGQLEGPQVGSESHFLRYCTDTCGEVLACVGGICTQSCTIGDDSVCTPSSSAAICTNESVEPGEIAVCDLPCSGTLDCSGLSGEHECIDGYCRAPAAPLQTGASSRYRHAQLAAFLLDRDRLSCGFSPNFMNEDGTFSCDVVRVEKKISGFDGSPDCFAPGRKPAGRELSDYLRGVLLAKNCVDVSDECMTWDMCGLVQLGGDERTQCVSASSTSASSGFCAIDLELENDSGVALAGGGSAMEGIVEDECGSQVDGARALRLSGDNTFETIESEIWLVCEEVP